MQEKYRHRKQKLYMCFLDIEKAFDRVPTKMMQCVMREERFISSDYKNSDEPLSLSKGKS